ncbi:MAG: ATP-binding protein [Alphaproteobacteria bacterium]
MLSRLTFPRLRKPTPVVALTIAVALVLGGVAMAVLNERAYSNQKANEVEVQARILAATVTAALVFDDHDAAQEYVNALRVNPEIQAAAVYGKGGALIATYTRTSEEPPPEASPVHDTYFEEDHLVLAAPVIQAGTALGTVYLRVTAEPLINRIVRYGGIALLVVMAALMVGVLGVSHSALAKANTELGVVNRELEAFNYSVSHDLRAPLRAIDGFSQALLEDCADRLDDQGRRHLNRVRQAAQRMGQLIDDFLDLSRVSRRELEVSDVDLETLALDIMRELRSDAPQREAEIKIASRLSARGDPHLLRIALENLLGNAWKFTAGRSPALIEFGQTRVGNANAFYVRDNGVGFDMAHAGKLFGAFQRLHDAREFAGTGIGLATVQRIVHKHGGRIWAEAEAGKGAAFYFTL